MTDLPVVVGPTEIAEAGLNRVADHPAAVYLAGSSAGSRRMMGGALEAMACIQAGDDVAKV